MRAQAGSALVEAIVAALLSALVMASAAVLLGAQSRLARSVSERSERNDAARSALLTVAAELETAAPASDVRTVARDSIASRIFRGVAVVCGFRNEWTYVHYRGLRLPDPAKDSVLQIGPENTAVLFSASASADACPREAGSQTLVWSVNAPAPVGSMWLVFENGSYHLSTNALRYRRGAETRQPVTNEVIDDRRSAFSARADSMIRGIGIRINHRGAAGERSRNVRLLNAR